MGRRGGRDWEAWDAPRGRLPADGIRAQTQRGAFGATWWAGRWLAALEEIVDAGRLTRGRSYARSGQVTQLDVGPNGVDALVQGSRPQPYRVTIGFRRLSDDAWDAVADAMAGQALFAARLLAGEMPEQIEEAFQAAGATLFPAEDADLETDCTCPDWANPCKHVAAVFYLLGERFGADPFLMFELRGRTKDEITAALRARRATPDAATLGAVILGLAPAGGGDSLPEQPGAPDGSGERSVSVPLFDGRDGSADGVAAFWTAPPALADVAVTFGAPVVDALPVKLLGPPPAWPRERDFPSEAERVYRAIGEQARRLVMEGAAACGSAPGSPGR